MNIHILPSLTNGQIYQLQQATGMIVTSNGTLAPAAQVTSLADLRESKLKGLLPTLLATDSNPTPPTAA